MKVTICKSACVHSLPAHSGQHDLSVRVILEQASTGHCFLWHLVTPCCREKENEKAIARVSSFDRKNWISFGFQQKHVAPSCLHHTSSWCTSSRPPAAPRGASCRCSGRSSFQICSTVGRPLASCRCAPGLQGSSLLLDTPCSSQRGCVSLGDCKSVRDTSPSHSGPPQ